MGSLQEYIQSRQSDGVKTRTINYGLQTVRRILNLAGNNTKDKADAGGGSS